MRAHRPVDTRAAMLRTILFIYGFTGIVSFILLMILPQDYSALQWVCVGFIVSAAVMLWLLQRDRVTLVAYCLVVTFFVWVTLAQLVATGTLGAGITGYVLVIVLAGMVLSPGALRTVTASSVVAIVLIGYSFQPLTFFTDSAVQLKAVTYSVSCIVAGWLFLLLRRHTNMALESSEAYFESAIHAARDMVTVVGPDQLIQYDSPSVERILGYAPGQRVGHHWSNYAHPDDVQRTADDWLSMVSDPQTSSPPVPIRVLHANGAWIDTECTVQYLPNLRDASAPNLLVSVRDIRQRKRAEAELEQRMAFERLVADISAHFMALPMSGTAPIDEGILYALKRVGEFMDADLALLFQISDDRVLNRNTHIWSAPGMEAQGVLRPATLLDDNGGWWLNKLVTHGLIYFPDLNEPLPPDTPQDIQPILQAKGVRSLMSVPLIRNGVILGELGLDAFRQPLRYSDENVRLVRVVAELIGGAIERQRAAAALKAERNSLEQRVNERTHELQQLLEVARTMSSELALEPLLQLVLAGIKNTVGYSSSAIAELVGGTRIHTLAADGPDASTRMISSAWRYDPQQDIHFQQLVEEHMPVLIPDVSADTPYAIAHRARYLRTIGELPSYLKSSLYLPLIARDEYIGHMALHSEEPGYFTQARADLAFAFARQAAVAIENARLHEEAMQNAAMSERRRLARELHDSVSQALFGIVLGSRTAMQLGAKTPAEGALKYVLDLSEGALAEMRALIFELRPESLETDGLLMALDKQATALAARHNLKVHLNLDTQEPALDIKAKEALYRIALEAIQNTIKHAHASEVTLSLQVLADSVRLQIADNGRGFDAQKTVQGHYGLSIMHERAEQFGGSLRVATADSGTQVTVELPLLRQAALASE